MAKKSMTPSERREAILRVLCQRRQDKIDNLAEEFGVSVRTIKNDIEELTLAPCGRLNRCRAVFSDH